MQRRLGKWKVDFRWNSRRLQVTLNTEIEYSQIRGSSAKLVLYTDPGVYRDYSVGSLGNLWDMLGVGWVII